MKSKQYTDTVEKLQEGGSIPRTKLLTSHIKQQRIWVESYVNFYVKLEKNSKVNF